MHDLVEQANSLGPFDAVVHNAGVMQGAVLPVNITAPYLMTAGIVRPRCRRIYLSSSMHRGGHPDLAGVDWTGKRETHSYSDAKLFVTRSWPPSPGSGRTSSRTRSTPAGCPRRWADPARRRPRPGARHAGLARDHRDPAALVSGRYWHHERTEKTHPAVHDDAFQDALLSSLAEQTGVALPAHDGDTDASRRRAEGARG